MGYTEYFNFEREPFSNAPNDKFYFDSDQYKQALLRLRYSVDSDKGLAVLVGGIGTGKTTLAGGCWMIFRWTSMNRHCW